MHSRESNGKIQVRSLHFGRELIGVVLISFFLPLPHFLPFSIQLKKVHERNTNEEFGVLNEHSVRCDNFHFQTEIFPSLNVIFQQMARMKG